MISLRVITRTELPRTRTLWLMLGLAVNQSFNDRERNTLGSWKRLGGQDALRFGNGHDLLDTLSIKSTEDWKMTFTSFSEEDAIWRIVPFSNVEDFFIISTKQIESTHLEEQPLTVSYLPFLLICSSSFVLLFTLSLTNYAFPPTSSTLKNTYRRQIDFRKLRRDSEFSDEIDSFLLLLLFFSSSNSTYEEGTQPTYDFTHTSLSHFCLQRTQDPVVRKRTIIPEDNIACLNRKLVCVCSGEVI